MDIKKRLYNDFFRPSKEDDYERILKTAKDYGYEFHTLLSLENYGGNSQKQKCLLLRHDIDTADFKILKKMLFLEKKVWSKIVLLFSVEHHQCRTDERNC